MYMHVEGYFIMFMGTPRVFPSFLQRKNAALLLLMERILFHGGKFFPLREAKITRILEMWFLPDRALSQYRVKHKKFMTLTP